MDRVGFEPTTSAMPGFLRDSLYNLSRMARNLTESEGIPVLLFIDEKGESLEK
jgi:hypothetical protein